jgi:DNA polymerase-3 subunit epsilon
MRAIAWAREVVRDPGTVFLDTETTGLDGRAEIIDIAIVDLAGLTLLDTLVRPQARIPAEASAIHGILDHHVAGAPRWRDVYGEMLSLLTDRRVVVYNASYDRRMVHQCCDAHSLLPPECIWECAMQRYAEYVGERSQRGRGCRRHKLEVAAGAFGLAPGGHRARADADVCRQVVQRMALG